MKACEGAGAEGGGRGVDGGKKGAGGTAFWGRVCSNTPSVTLRADLRGDDITFGRSSQCDVMSPPLMWISGLHFIIHHVVPASARRKGAGGDPREPRDGGKDDEDDEEEEDEDMDEDDLESYVEIEDKSRFGTWLNGVLIGNGMRMRAADGDKITLRAPSKHVTAAHPGRIDTITFVLRVLSQEELTKQKRFLISENHPINKEYSVLNTIGEFVHCFPLHQRSLFCCCFNCVCVLLFCRGQYSIVYEAVEKSTGEHFAVKVVSEEVTLKTPEKTEAAMRNINREMSIMQLLNHWCCIRVLRYINFNRTHCFVLELAGIDLFEYIRRNGPLPETIAQCLFVQMLSAIKYLHKLNVIHRDMKPENILLVQDGDCLICKVTDFGLARVLEQQELAITLCGTPLYVSPEIVQTRESKNPHGYGPSVDMWSLGAILYTMLSAMTPFNDQDPLIYQHILNGAIKFPRDRWSRISGDALSIVQGLMTVDVSRRLTCAQCFATPWCIQGLQHLSHTHSRVLNELAKEELADIKLQQQQQQQQLQAGSSLLGVTAAPSETMSDTNALKRGNSTMGDGDDDSSFRGQAPSKRAHFA